MTTPAPSPAAPTPTGAPAVADPVPVAAAGPERLSQPGVLGRPRPFLLLAALSFVPVAVQDRRDALERLRELVRDEHDGNLADPVVETGELGYVPLAGGRAPTVVVALSAQGYDALGVPGGLRPQDLVPVPSDVVPGLGQPTVPVPGEGHVLLHVQADDAFVAEHVLRRAERDLVHDFTVVWAELASQRGGQPAGRDTGRSLLGFLDGTSNPDLRVPADVALVVVDSGKVGGYPPLPADPPSGAYAAVPGASSAFPTLRPPPLAEDPGNDGGSYLAVQVNLLRTGAFDQTPVAGQEQVVGRHKRTGVSLDLVPETAHAPADEPVYATDPASLVVPVNSHVRKANPRRTAERDGERRMLRRGYPLVRRDGNTLGRGLVFVAFARSLSTQFEFVTRAWLNNPNFPTPGAGVDALSAFVGPAVCGGYYFAPPLQDPTRPETWQVPAAG